MMALKGLRKCESRRETVRHRQSLYQVARTSRAMTVIAQAMTVIAEAMMVVAQAMTVIAQAMMVVAQAMTVIAGTTEAWAASAA
jgi:hypothetical protein